MTLVWRGVGRGEWNGSDANGAMSKAGPKDCFINKVAMMPAQWSSISNVTEPPRFLLPPSHHLPTTSTPHTRSIFPQKS
jgi:hypothetical protein